MQVRSQRMTRATYLARSAVEYYNYKDFVSNGAMPNIVGPLAVGPANLHQFISVTKDPSGDARCRGWIEDSSGRVLAERTMFVPKDPVTPGGRRDRAYDEGL